MELRASSGVDMAEDLTLPLPPLAAALHHPFLHSHCSSCFIPITRSPQEPSPLCLSCCPASLRYCSTACQRSDVIRHISSGECRLFNHCHLLDGEHNITDLRVALRLLHSFEQSGVLHGRRPERVGGLLTMEKSKVDEGWNMANKVKEGAEVMASVTGNAGGAEVEEAVLWVVVVNGVEVVRVECGGGEALGTAVYGPMFSWFNHSCSPNACYRFEMGGLKGDADGALGFRIHPHGNGEGAVDVLRSWIEDERKFNQESCRFGPQVIVRSIKPIGKNEEVCITYTDLIQPKALRQLDLWEKYHFVCCCSRCAAIPENFVDRMLNDGTTDCNDKTLNVHDDYKQDGAQQEAADTLDEAIAEYLSVGDPKACCEKIETIFTKTSQRGFKLQPLHHISINAYITLASAYKVRMENSVFAQDSSESSNVKGCRNVSRTATSYSLLLAGISNYIFSYEVPVIGTTAIFWINAGESLLTFVRLLASDSASNPPNLSETQVLSPHSHHTALAAPFPTKQAEFVTTCMDLLACINGLCLKAWPILAAGSPSLANIKNPIDFGWVGRTSDPSVPRTIPDPSCEGGGSCCKHVYEDRMVFYELALHCIEYGCYLAKFCYGSYCPLVTSGGNLVGKTPPFYG